jgi:uncharacterized protein (TIGR00369 family)
MTPIMTEAELTEFMYRAFPQAADDFHVEQLTPDGIVMRLRVAERHLRPGGTISGPTMFGLADVAVYLAILARIGPVALAVTTNGTIDFLRKPAAGVDLLAKARLLKLGKVLAVGDVLIRSEGVAEPVARSSMTYSVPPQR